MNLSSLKFGETAHLTEIIVFAEDSTQNVIVLKNADDWSFYFSEPFHEVALPLAANSTLYKVPISCLPNCQRPYNHEPRTICNEDAVSSRNPRAPESLSKQTGSICRSSGVSSRMM